MIPVFLTIYQYSPFNSQIKFVILFTVNHKILLMLVQRVKYGIN